MQPLGPAGFDALLSLSGRLRCLDLSCCELLPADAGVLSVLTSLRTLLLSGVRTLLPSSSSSSPGSGSGPGAFSGGGNGGGGKGGGGSSGNSTAAMLGPEASQNSMRLLECIVKLTGLTHLELNIKTSLREVHGHHSRTWRRTDDGLQLHGNVRALRALPQLACLHALRNKVDATDLADLAACTALTELRLAWLQSNVHLGLGLGAWNQLARLTGLVRLHVVSERGRGPRNSVLCERAAAHVVCRLDYC